MSQEIPNPGLGPKAGGYFKILPHYVFQGFLFICFWLQMTKTQLKLINEKVFVSVET